MSCIATLRAGGLKLTPQRRLIADILHDTKGHLTAREIVGRVQAKMPGVNKSTIYRTLDVLEQAGCLYKSEMKNEFVYHHHDGDHHYHLTCIHCGKTVDFDEGIFFSLQRSLVRKYGFHADLKHVVLNGVCSDCKKRSN